MMSRWIVPVDDTNTMFIEFRHVSETDGATPPWWADRTKMLPGQVAEESYEAGQRHPGDYEAQVSQRPIAIHGLEHLGATDRGISMFRNQIRRGVRAVGGGHDPAGLVREAPAKIATYCNDTIVRLPGSGERRYGSFPDARRRASPRGGLFAEPAAVGHRGERRDRITGGHCRVVLAAAAKRSRAFHFSPSVSAMGRLARIAGILRDIGFPYGRFFGRQRKADAPRMQAAAMVPPTRVGRERRRIRRRPSGHGTGARRSAHPG